MFKQVSKRKLPPANDWQARNIQNWNATTFRAYLNVRHEELYAIPYVARNYAMEAGMIKRMYMEHGKEATKAFIDACYSAYKPSKQYPGINFAFMYSYMRDRILPRILAEQKAEIEKELRQKNTADYAAIADLL